jgi:hypothetical protein
VQFFNPALLAGALLFAVPLVIHLLNRQRHKRRPWAAMEFLLRAYQKQRNRLRNENLLLLLLRCLVPIVLALAIARPLWQQVQGLLAGQGIVHHVVVVDGSYSMGLRRDGAPSPFEKARGLLGRLLERWEGNQNRSDKVTLVLAGVRPRFLVRGDLDLASVRAQWLLLQKPEDAASDLTEALQQIDRALAEQPDPAVQVYVMSDLQARSLGKGFAEPARAGAAAPAADPTAGVGAGGDPTAAGAAGGPEFTDTVRDMVEQLQKRPGTHLHWIDLGPLGAARQGGTVDNVQLTDLRISQPAAVLRTPVEVIATLRNRGQTAQNVEVTLDVDGSEPVRKLVAVPAGSEGEAEFQLSFRDAGRHRLRASLPNDALAADDERFASLEVRDRIRVLLVDGEQGGDPLRSYQYLWQSMLDPDPTALPTFAVETVDTVALLGGQCTPKNHDVIVLADVERLNQRSAEALREALQLGRGLFVAVGEHADHESYNRWLYDGDGPMPFRLLRAQGGSQGTSAARAPSLLLPQHPLFAEFEEAIYREVLQAIPVWRWHGVAADSLRPDAELLARLTDADQTPLLAARAFGLGKAVFLTSPIASEFKPDRWNRLDDPMVAFPLLHGLAKWLALPAVDAFHQPVGAELTCTVPARPLDIEVQRPDRDGRPKAPLAEDPLPLPGGRFRLPPLADTAFAGFYTFDLVLDRDAGKEALSLPFAVNVDPEEGDLRYLAHEQARTGLGLERILDGLPAAANARDDTDASELGPSLLLLTLLLVLGEAALARYVSVRRS